MTTGQLIRMARKKAQMTQAELAQKLGISYVGISQWENDLRNPKIETLNRIASAIGIEAIELVPEDKQDEYIFAYMQYVKECQKQGVEFIPDWTGPPSTPEENRRKRLLAFYDYCLNDDGKIAAIERIKELAEIPRYQAKSTQQLPLAPVEDATPPNAPETPPKEE